MCSGWDARYSTKGLGEDKFALAGTQGTYKRFRRDLVCYGWDARYSTKGLGETKCALAGTQGTVQKVLERISLLLLGRKVQYKKYRRG